MNYIKSNIHKINLVKTNIKKLNFIDVFLIGCGLSTTYNFYKSFSGPPYNFKMFGCDDNFREDNIVTYTVMSLIVSSGTSVAWPIFVVMNTSLKIDDFLNYMRGKEVKRLIFDPNVKDKKD